MKPTSPRAVPLAPAFAIAPALLLALALALGAPSPAHALRVADEAYWAPPVPTGRWGQAWDTGSAYIVAAVQRIVGAEVLEPVFPWLALTACADKAKAMDRAKPDPSAVYVAVLAPAATGPWKIVSEDPGKSAFKPACVGRSLAAAFAGVTPPARSLTNVTIALALVTRPPPGTAEPHSVYVDSPAGTWIEGTAPAGVAAGVRACLSGGWLSYGAAPTVSTGTLTIVVRDRSGLIAEVKSVTGALASDGIVRCLKSALAEASPDPKLPETTVVVHAVAGETLSIEAKDAAALRTRLLEPRSPHAAASPPPPPSEDVLGGLIGSTDTSPTGGLGLHGTGSGGGGTGEGTIGLGSLRGGTIGSGPGAGVGMGKGRLSSKGGPVVRPGAPTTKGHLDKAIIQRVIRSKLAMVRYCYEKELIKDAKLAGAVKLRFVIGADGTVPSAAADGATDGTPMAPVAACVAVKARTWVFPKPEGGGTVDVTYPFVFKPE